MYMGIGGGELQIDAAKYVAQECVKQGVMVIWDEYELMPHNWPMFLPRWPQARACMEAWAGACRKFARTGVVESSGRVVGFEDGVVRQVDVRNLTGLTEKDMRRAMVSYVEDLEEEGKAVLMKELWSQLSGSKL